MRKEVSPRLNTQKTDGLKRKWTDLEAHLSKMTFAEIIPDSRTESIKVDLSKNTLDRLKIASTSREQLSAYIFGDSSIRHGGYMERRNLYSPFPEYATNSRDTHLGIDIWVAEGTPIFCPYDAVVFAAHNNEGKGNYGPTIILKHMINDICFYTLYGHLSNKSVRGIRKGQILCSGQLFSHTGNASENGGWPPHLHFQIILDLLNNDVDFPGVCSQEERKLYELLCPDPNHILQIHN
jgi:murein DD-endopeptidase MepM/ murein hydrolase activator NlpD